MASVALFVSIFFVASTVAMELAVTDVLSEPSPMLTFVAFSLTSCPVAFITPLSVASVALISTFFVAADKLPPETSTFLLSSLRSLPSPVMRISVLVDWMMPSAPVASILASSVIMLLSFSLTAS